MRLEELWKKYTPSNSFNSWDLPDKIKAQGIRITYKPGSVIIAQGDFPKYIHFIESGIGSGVKHYANGSRYHYFHVSSKAGSLGLLEVLAQKPHAVATVIAATEVTVLRIPSSIIFEYLMTHTDMFYTYIFNIAQDFFYLSNDEGKFYYQKCITRIRYYLIQHYVTHSYQNKEISIQEDYQTIAESICCSVRTVVRNIKELKDSDELTVKNKKICISQKQYLKMLNELNESL